MKSLCCRPESRYFWWHILSYGTNDGAQNWDSDFLSVYFSDDLVHWREQKILSLADIPW